jgi:hypothetical protein
MHRTMSFLRARYQIIEQPLAHIRWCRRREAGSCAFGRVRYKGEVRDKQYAAIDILDTTIHFSGFVRKDTESQQAINESRRSDLVISAFNPDQD